MNKKQFEEKYLLHNFFWIRNEKQANELQDIMIEFGYTNPIGDINKIKYHQGFNNLVTFPPNKWNKTKFFQKIDIYNPNYSFGIAVNYEQFLLDYNNLKL